MIRYYLLFFLALVSLSVFSQNYSQRMNISELLAKIKNHPGDTFVIENAIIYFTKNDERFTKTNENDSLSNIFINSLDTLFISKKLIFRNLKFEGNAKLNKVVFLEEVEFDKVDWDIDIFYNCRFVKNTRFLNLLKVSNVNFGYTVFEGNAIFHNIESYVGFRGCFFKKDLNVGGLKRGVRFDECTFKGNNIFRQGGYKGGSTQFYYCNFEPVLRKHNPFKGYCVPLGMWEYSFGDKRHVLFIGNCTFKKATDSDVVNLASNEFSYLGIGHSKFEMPVLLLSSQTEEMDISENEFVRVDLRDFNYIINFASFDFGQISHKISIKSNDYTEYDKNYVPYFGKSDNELKEEHKFKELLAVYAKLLAVYKFRADQASYNDCYIEMKNLQTRKAGFDFQNRKNLPNLFSWQLNRFLQYFCDYGTNPARALVVSFYVICIFAGIYFVFPSEEDNLSKNRFMSFFQNSILYFNTDKQLSDFQQEIDKQDLLELAAFRQNLLSSQKNIPGIIVMLGIPFYNLSIFYNRFTLWLLKRTNVVKGTWDKLSKLQKMTLGFWVSLYFIGFVFWGFFMRILNAVTLSMNVFVTLGYGEIPAKGFMRYLAVVEGVCGWFLLSIFSVSLISQVL